MGATMAVSTAPLGSAIVVTMAASGWALAELAALKARGAGAGEEDVRCSLTPPLFCESCSSASFLRRDSRYPSFLRLDRLRKKLSFEGDEEAY